MNFLSTINEIKEVTGLSDIGAKKVLYYSGATYGLEHLSKFPLLSVQGEPSTGKTTILNITHKISKDASKFIRPNSIARSATVPPTIGRFGTVFTLYKFCTIQQGIFCIIILIWLALKCRMFQRSQIFFFSEVFLVSATG